VTTQPIAAHRHVHYVRENARSETIHQCVWYDCETEPVKNDDGSVSHRLVFGWAAYSRRRTTGEWTEPKWIRFTKGKELWKWIDQLTRPKKTLYVWAHNAYFDGAASCSASEITGMGWVLQDAIIDSPPYVMRYRKSSRKIVLIDTLNIWRMSLKKLGTLVGLRKLDLPETWTNSNQDDEYCRRDVEIIMKAVCDWADFLVREDMGKFCLTVASQAMHTFRHKYLHDEILIDDDRTALEISRAAYRGGRVECLFVGEMHGPLYLLDINSLYPYCMSRYEYPTKLIRIVEYPSASEVQDLLAKYLLCCDATIETSLASIGVRRDNKLIFPTGRFDAHITTPELIHLIEQGDMTVVKRCAVYEKGIPFVEFVTDLYGHRVRANVLGNSVESEHYKLLLNSFYGKWGQNGIKWTTVGRTDKAGIAFWPEIDYMTDKVVNFRRWDGLVQRKDTYPESANSHPAIAAHITAYGRMVLWTLMRQMPPKTALYCDTDSLLVLKEGLKQVEHAISDSVLGGIKLVGQYGNARIYGCKDYVLDGARTCKGIRENAVDLGDGHFQQKQWVGFRRALRKGWLDAPRVLTLDKRLKRVYDKGLVSSDGWVSPFVLGHE
jgi:DNA polymerase type B, organellar and viral